MKRVAMIFVVAGLSFACQQSEERFLAHILRTEDVTGTWVMDEASEQDLRAIGYSFPVNPNEHWIAITADGTCRFHTFREINLAVNLPTPLINKPCRWKFGLDRHQSLKVEVEDDGRLFNVTYRFWEEHGHLLVWQYLDDPDQWHYLEYVRER